MAHQAHALPWSSLSSNFKFGKFPHLDARFADIQPLGKPSQAKQVVYFGKAMAKQIRDFAATERAKYPSPGEYQTRAKTWTVSTREPDDILALERGVGQMDVRSMDAGSAAAKKKKRNEQQREKSKTVEAPETRKTFLDASEGTYRDRSGSSWIRGEYQYIENWTGRDVVHGAASQQEERLQIHRAQRSCADIIKVTLMEAACATQPSSERQRGPAQRYHMETLLLLAHHPTMPLSTFDNLPDCCCNNSSGIKSFATTPALRGYLYLNLLFAMRATGSNTSAFAQTDDPERAATPAFLGLLHWKTLAPRTPRASYMNSRSWQNLVAYLLYTHDNHPEILMHERFLFPEEEVSTQEGLQAEAEAKAKLKMEADPLEDGDALREYLRGLWKVMVLYDVLQREIGREVEWEKLVSEVLIELFPRLAVWDLDSSEWVLA